jgi:hypothetical protein
LLAPLEKVGGLIVGRDKSVDVGAELFGALKTGAAQRLPTEQAEPDFHLVEPGSMGGRVVKNARAGAVAASDRISACEY